MIKLLLTIASLMLTNDFAHAEDVSYDSDSSLSDSSDTSVVENTNDKKKGKSSKAVESTQAPSKNPFAGKPAEVKEQGVGKRVAPKNADAALNQSQGVTKGVNQNQGLTTAPKAQGTNLVKRQISDRPVNQNQVSSNALRAQSQSLTMNQTFKKNASNMLPHPQQQNGLAHAKTDAKTDAIKTPITKSAPVTPPPGGEKPKKPVKEPETTPPPSDPVKEPETTPPPSDPVKEPETTPPPSDPVKEPETPPPSSEENPETTPSGENPETPPPSSEPVTPPVVTEAAKMTAAKEALKKVAEEAARKVNEKKQNKAAIKIESLFRGHKARKRFKEMKKKREEAAIKIESLFRGELVRKKVEKMKAEGEAAKRKADAKVQKNLGEAIKTAIINVGQADSGSKIDRVIGIFNRQLDKIDAISNMKSEEVERLKKRISLNVEGDSVKAVINNIKGKLKTNKKEGLKEGLNTLQSFLHALQDTLPKGIDVVKKIKDDKFKQVSEQASFNLASGLITNVLATQADVKKNNQKCYLGTLLVKEQVELYKTLKELFNNCDETGKKGMYDALKVAITNLSSDSRTYPTISSDLNKKLTNYLNAGTSTDIATQFNSIISILEETNFYEKNKGYYDYNNSPIDPSKDYVYANYKNYGTDFSEVIKQLIGDGNDTLLSADINAKLSWLKMLEEMLIRFGMRDLDLLLEKKMKWHKELLEQEIEACKDIKNIKGLKGEGLHILLNCLDGSVELKEPSDDLLKLLGKKKGESVTFADLAKYIEDVNKQRDFAIANGHNIDYDKLYTIVAEEVADKITKDEIEIDTKTVSDKIDKRRNEIGDTFNDELTYNAAYKSEHTITSFLEASKHLCKSGNATEFLSNAIETGDLSTILHAVSLLDKTSIGNILGKQTEEAWIDSLKEAINNKENLHDFVNKNLDGSAVAFHEDVINETITLDHMIDLTKKTDYAFHDMTKVEHLNIEAIKKNAKQVDASNQ